MSSMVNRVYRTVGSERVGKYEYVEPEEKWQVK